MHPSNFDELTKALAETRSRRQALRVILTASIGGLLGLFAHYLRFGPKARDEEDLQPPQGARP